MVHYFGDTTVLNIINVTECTLFETECHTEIWFPFCTFKDTAIDKDIHDVMYNVIINKRH